MSGIPASRRTFGVEIETCIPVAYTHQWSVGHYHAGKQIPGLPIGWTAQGDGSLEAPDGYRAVEIVSPVLSGADGLRQIVLVANWLKSMHAQPNETTGLHVHIGADDLGMSEVNAVRRAFIRYESAFLALNGEDATYRIGNTYCQLAANWSRYSIDEVDRYCSLNCQNWYLWQRRGGSKPTLECRIWQSTTDDTKIVAAVLMFMALVTRAVELGARTHTPIDEPTTAMRDFVANHFGHGIVSEDLRIIPDKPVADVIYHAWKETKRAKEPIRSARNCY